MTGVGGWLVLMVGFALIALAMANFVAGLLHQVIVGLSII